MVVVKAVEKVCSRIRIYQLVIEFRIVRIAISLCALDGSHNDSHDYCNAYDACDEFGAQ